MGCLVGGKTKECFLLIWNLPTCTPIICQSTKCVCIFRGQVCNWKERETETQMQRTNVWTPRGEGGGGGGGGMNWEIGIDIYTLICIKLITNKNLLYKKKKFQTKKENVAEKEEEVKFTFSELCNSQSLFGGCFQSSEHSFQS